MKAERFTVYSDSIVVPFVENSTRINEMRLYLQSVGYYIMLSGIKCSFVGKVRRTRSVPSDCNSFNKLFIWIKKNIEQIDGAK